MNLDLPYIYCGICLKNVEEISRTSSKKLYLTSCAHLTCKQHIQQSFGNSVTCPICQTQNASIVPMDESLPAELKQFFVPSPQQVETLISSVNFQYCSLIEMVNHYKSANLKLNDKLKKSKELLYAAKEEVLELQGFKSQVEDLKSQVSKLQRQLNEQRPETVDLSSFRMESRESIPVRPANVASNTFIENIHKQSSQRMTQRNKISPLGISSPTPKEQPPSFFAESTKIVNRQRSGSIISSNTSRSGSGSSRNSLIHNPTKIRKNLGTNSRSLTSQLASRITANMRIGGTVSTTRATSSSNQSVGNSLHPTRKYSTDRIQKQSVPTLNRSLQRDGSPYFRN
ncbi:Chromosome stability protein 9 [Spathaspora sp. JA1]|nr:Chromosome stability protein 9 [Spathaspora sp. JA1]